MSQINPKHTKAILIGVSEFRDAAFINAAPIKNNVTRLYKLLQEPEVMGLPAKNILLLNQNERHDDMLEAIDGFVEDSEQLDSILFYFAGHGYITEADKKFHLITHNTNKRRIIATSISWEEIKETLEKGNGIKQRLYILDACHSGGATLSGGDSELDMKDGSALIAAAKADKKSYFNHTDTYTHFTDAFIHVLENGILKHEKPGLDPGSLHDELDRKLKKKNFEITPKQAGIIGNVEFFKNKGYDKIAIKRNEIRKIIKEADVFFKKLDFKNAELLYGRAGRKAKPADKFQALLKQIEKKIDRAEEIKSYEKIFADYYQKQNQQNLEVLTAQQKELQEQLTQKDQQISLEQSKTNQHKKAEAQLLKEKEALTTQIKALKKDDTLSQKKAQELEKEISRQKEKIAQLEKGIGKYKTSIENLRQELAEEKQEITALKAEAKKQQKHSKELENALSIVLDQKEILVAAQKEQVKKNASSPASLAGQDYTEKVKGVELDMVFVQGGSFDMGSNENDHEKPIHEVELSDYYIGKYQVTQELWKAVVGNDPSYFKGDKLPVESVSWNDAQLFIKNLNQKTGKDYRLLTEAEWEYAARGGQKSKDFEYAGSDDLNKIGWYKGNAKKKTHPVGELAPNELGLYDMSGNVWEWCEDDVHKNYEGAPTDGSVWVDSTRAEYRVLRGSSSFRNAVGCRPAYRYMGEPGSRGLNLGLRLALARRV